MCKTLSGRLRYKYRRETRFYEKEMSRESKFPPTEESNE